MSKLRRFHVFSLNGLNPNDAVRLPEDEAKHARVLRLEQDTEIEIFDDHGFHVRAHLTGDSAKLIGMPQIPTTPTRHLTLGLSWPKGKRAAILVEKCSELGVNRIVPIKYLRSVVSKRDESEGIVRLRRIASEAAKQSGRHDVPEIAEEISFTQVLDETSHGFSVMLDPAAEMQFATILADSDTTVPVFLLVGPEGGFSAEEIQAAEARAIRRARLAANVLRVETAAIAACAIFQGIKGGWNNRGL